MEWELICQLLDVVESTRGYPKLKRLHDEAMAELEALAEPDEEKVEPSKYVAKEAPIKEEAGNGRRV